VIFEEIWTDLPEFSYSRITVQYVQTVRIKIDTSKNVALVYVRVKRTSMEKGLFLQDTRTNSQLTVCAETRAGIFKAPNSQS
jgi:hypothetical protein